MEKVPKPFRITTFGEGVAATIVLLVVAVLVFFYCISAYLILRIPVGWAKSLGYSLAGDGAAVVFFAIATILACVCFGAFSAVWFFWLAFKADPKQLEVTEQTIAE